MARGNIQNDVVQLLDKYKVTEILEVIMDIASDSSVNEMREWFGNNLGENCGDGENRENDEMVAVFHDMEHLNMRVLKLERDAEKNRKTGDMQTGDMQTTGNVPKEIVDAISDWKKYRKDDKLK